MDKTFGGFLLMFIINYVIFLALCFCLVALIFRIIGWPTKLIFQSRILAILKNRLGRKIID